MLGFIWLYVTYQASFAILGQEMVASRPDYVEKLIKPMENQAFLHLEKRQEAENRTKPMEKPYTTKQKSTFSALPLLSLLKKRQEARNLIKPMENIDS